MSVSEGRSGNRSGYKVFSFNTTVRNPLRNVDFLKCFLPYDGKKSKKENLEAYFFDLVKSGVYKLTNVSREIKRKQSMGFELTDYETNEAIKNNPQKTGVSGRVMTQLRALKEQGFLKFKGTSHKYTIHITELGHDLLKDNQPITDIYTRAMIGIHAKSPARISILNESRPFLNTIFTIEKVNREWEKLGNEPKGVLMHEFAAFILTMKDCDYNKAATEIINYRKKYGKEINITALEDYIFNKLGLLKVQLESVFKDYADDVYRKFAMTNLIQKRGVYKYTYIDFSKYNIEKIKSIVNKYRGYSFVNFKDVDEYYSYLYNIELPWIVDQNSRLNILKSKASSLGKTIDLTKGLNEVEKELDDIHFNSILSKRIDEVDLKTINMELYILSGEIDKKSKYDEISEPLRLEFMLALLIGKVYGKIGLISNIIYSEDGTPLSFAPAGKADIIYDHDKYPLIIEPTMIKNRSQQLNSETTNIVRHMIELKRVNSKDYRTMMIAPYIHQDVARYFKFEAVSNNVSLAPITIGLFVKIVNSNNEIGLFAKKFDEVVEYLKNNDPESYLMKVNTGL